MTIMLYKSIELFTHIPTYSKAGASFSLKVLYISKFPIIRFAKFVLVSKRKKDSMQAPVSYCCLLVKTYTQNMRMIK